MGKDVAVVIGLGGMGLAIARRVGSGRALVLADVDATGLKTVATSLRDEGHDVTTQVVDIADCEAVAALAATAAALGGITHLAHTAGLSPVQASTEAILRVDLLGVAHVLEEFAPVIAPGGAGVVIASMAPHLAANLSVEQERALASTPAPELLALPFLAPDVVGDSGLAYVVAKRGTIVRVEAAAGVWGKRGARINSISPGIISTSMGQQELASETGDGMRSLLEMSAAKRLGTAEDIANAAVFLLARESSFITGTDLLVDGGAVAAVRPFLPAG